MPSDRNDGIDSHADNELLNIAYGNEPVKISADTHAELSSKIDSDAMAAMPGQL